MNESGGTLGEFLRSGRQRAGLTLEQISAETKIPVQHLRALEAEDLSVLRGGFYQRAEIRAYARVVRVDQHLALEHLERLLHPAPPEVAPQPSKVPFSIASPGKVAALIGVVAGSLILALATTGREELVAEPAHEVQLPSADDAHAQPAAPEQTPEPPAVGTASLPEDQAAVPPNRETELVIVSEPPGAWVTVDGIGWGETPVSVRNLAPGARRIRVTKAGFTSEERVAPLTTDRPTTIRISLQTKPD